MKYSITTSTLAAMLAIATPVTAATLPTATGFLEAQEVPVRVYYATPAQEALAPALLDAAVYAWTIQIKNMEFAIPMTVNDDLEPIEGARLYLVAGGGFAGTARPFCDVPGTPQADCASVILISDTLPEDYYPNVVFHELNHAAQEAVDCKESDFAYEQVTVAVTELFFPSDFFISTVGDFQSAPFHSLDWTNFGVSYYHFGAALFSYFLEQHYGQANGTLLARIWAATAEEGTIEIIEEMGWSYAEKDVPNEPDLLDAMRTVLADDGIDFDDAFSTFSTYRYFTGGYDVGAHLPDAGSWTGTEPVIDTRWYADELPVLNAQPDDAPHDLGVSYIAFDLAAMVPDAALGLSFWGWEGVDWRASVLAISEDNAVEIPMTLDGDRHGSAFVNDLTHLKRVVLVVTNLGDGLHDADDEDWVGTNFTYAARLVSCPEISIIVDQPVELGPGETKVTVTGDGFAGEQDLEVALSGEGIAVAEVIRLSSTALDVTLDVAADAAPGSRDLSVTLECGAVGVGAGLILVTDPNAAGGSGGDGGAGGSGGSGGGSLDPNDGVPGGGCQSLGAGLGSVLGILLALLCYFRRRRLDLGRG